jgi:murein DD-endopeptidase MepM/ murein hydrolase activator NlpD
MAAATRSTFRDLKKPAPRSGQSNGAVNLCCGKSRVVTRGTAILDHGRHRGAYRTRAEADAIDLGNEPPLFVDGRSSALADRRRVSVRWFIGTVLTGLSGAALMGGAVYAALDREANFAAIPERLEASLRGTLSADRQAITRKADKLQPVIEAPSARQVLRVSTTTRIGEREVVRMRPFVRIMANLSLSTSDLSANVPPFDARKLLANSGPGAAPATPEEAGAEPDAEITFVTRELAPLLPKLKVASLLPIEEVIARVREAADWTGSAAPVPGVGAGGTKLAYAHEGTLDPYSGFEARIVPENITLLPKTATQATGGNAWNERLHVVKKGDTINSILREFGASADEAKAVANALGRRGRDNGLKEGQKLRILLQPIAVGQRLQPIRVIIATDSAIEAVVALSDTGRYVSVDVQSADTQVAEAEEDDDTAPSGVRLYQSVYETALRQQVPRPVIDDLIRVYSYDVDFQRRVQPGDSFELLYGGEDESGSDARSEVLYTSLTIGGETKRYYRYQTPDDGVVDYYDETGKSAKKFLVRKPMAAGLMRSGYGWRRHPILGYAKMHTGVDWAAPRGTPIYASGNGIVAIAGWESGYGKYVRIRHTNGYETSYGHMSAFARGIQPGTRVRQGQIIGYVGSTGLSTGPHLHYEIMVNNRFVDPMRIKLPRGRVLDGPTLAEFERERDRADNMMNRPASRVAEGGAATRRR